MNTMIDDDDDRGLMTTMKAIEVLMTTTMMVGDVQRWVFELRVL